MVSSAAATRRGLIGGTLMGNKWAATIAGIYIQSFTGIPSAFGVYSTALKSSQNYTQSTLDVIASVKDLGASFGVLSGVLYSNQGRFGGPMMVLVFGAVQSFVGYLMVWLAVAGIVDRLPVWVMCWFVWLGSHAMSFSNTAVVVASVGNFREYSGTVVGIMKGFLGLSPAILVQFYQTIYGNNPPSFILMASLVSTICPLCLMWFIRNDTSSKPYDGQHLNNFSLILVIIAAYLAVVTVLQSFISLQLNARIIVSLILLLLLASPLFYMFRILHENPGETPEITFAGSDGCEGGSAKTYYELPNQSDDEVVDETTDEGPNINLMQAIRSANFWLLFISLTCSFGSGLALINNLAQVSESLGYLSSETSTFISLWGIWNSLGRFLGGSLSDYTQRVKGWPRPFFMTITVCIFSIGHGVMAASGFPGMLHVGSIITGLCTGSQMSIAPAIISEIFGLVDMGTIYNSIMLAGSLGSYIFSIIFGYLYDKEQSRQLGNACVGSRCFILSFLIMAAANLIGSVVSMILHLRTKRFYQRIMVRNLRHCVKT
ncbi:hypothetical protein Drorol1_Dr00004509 [Drosera rotundifolia]